MKKNHCKEYLMHRAISYICLIIMAFLIIFSRFVLYMVVVFLQRSCMGRYVPHQSVYSRLCKLCDDGTLENIFNSLLNEDSDFENVYM